MKKQNLKDELTKHAYMNFHKKAKYAPVQIVLTNGRKLKGEIVKEYTYEIIIDRKVSVKDKSGKEKTMLQEMLIPKHSIDYIYRNVEPDNSK